MGFNIQPAINAGLQKAERVYIDLGINPNNGLKTTALCNWIFPNYVEEFIKISFTIKQYAVLPDNSEYLVNVFEYIGKASAETMVDMEGNAVESGGAMNEWEYFGYLRNLTIHIPTLEDNYAQNLFLRGKFDKPRDIQG